MLVTGAAGFIGSALAPALWEAGHRVVGLDRVPAPNPAAFTDFRIADLCDRQALTDLLEHARPDVVIHAGGASGRPDPGSWMQLYFDPESFVNYSNYSNERVDELLARRRRPRTSRPASI